MQVLLRAMVILMGATLVLIGALLALSRHHDPPLVLAFSSDRTGVYTIYRMDADGSHLRPFPGIDQTSNYPVWSPDGRWLAYMEHPLPGGVLDVVRISSGGTGRTVLNPGGKCQSPAWSPASDRLALACQHGDAVEVFVSDRLPDADDVANDVVPGLHTVTTISIDDLPYTFAWSPDGRELVFLSSGDILRAALNDDSVQPVANRAARFDGNFAIDAAQALTWSPDGAWLVFTDPRGTIYRVQPDGHGLTLVTDRFAADRCRLTDFGNATWTWSPDGAWAALSATCANNQDIYRVHIASGTVERITTDPAIDYAPDWSPDGAWIAFVSKRAGGYDIFRVRAADSAAVPQRLTHDPAWDHQPDWSFTPHFHYRGVLVLLAGLLTLATGTGVTQAGGRWLRRVGVPWVAQRVRRGEPVESPDSILK